MNLLALGTAARSLFALHDPPAVPPRRARAAVLCNPGSVELIYAHRALRHLALRLSRAGMHVVRFDYFGTGDSGGDESTITMEGMQRDVRAAIEAVRDISGAGRVDLLGLRLGANVAALVAEADSGIGSLVLWDAMEHPALPARHPERVLRLVTEPAVPEGEAVQVRGPRCWEEAAAVTGALPVAAYQQIEAWLA